MHSLRHFALLPFLLFALSPFALSAQTAGKEFYICIPPNELGAYPTEALEVYIASEFDTEITVTDFEGKRTYKRTVKAGEIRTLTDARGETNWTWEVVEFEKPVTKGIRITAPNPITVYVFNSKLYSTDGYRAIPTAAWGTEHIVASYYDFREFDSWGGGFCVVAKEPTEVKIKLQGVNGSDGKTTGGKTLGDSITVNLKEGEVYAVCGNGLTRGVFDLTGTVISSTKPIGVFGFHQRTTMPNMLINGNGRNHLVEAIPPIYMWGKKYATLEYARSGNKPDAKGDLFRIISSEPNTKWVAKSYDLLTKQQTSNSSGILRKVGDFTDLTPSTGPTIMPNGFTVIEADKPILVVQYCNSSSFDGDQLLDPFMIVLVPVEQSVSRSIWMTPTTPTLSKHFLNVIVSADTSDPEYINNLKSVKIDDIPLWEHPRSRTPSLLSNHMGKGLHWATVEFGTLATSHRMTTNGKVQLTGYVYGTGAVDAYGWPLASASRDLSSIDTMPPLISGTVDCGTFTGRATDVRNVPNPPRAVPLDSDQVETGIALVDTLSGSNSYNYRLVMITSDEYPRVPSFKQFDFKFEVIDRSRPAYCVYYVQDWANNVTYDTLRYYPSAITFTPENLQFIERNLNQMDTIGIGITNSGSTPLMISSTSLAVGQHFRLLNPISAPGKQIGVGQTEMLQVVYLADRETGDATSDLDRDKLIIVDACTSWEIDVSGVTTQPSMVVEDYNADYISAGLRKCKPGGLLITNNGSDTLVITGFTGYEGSNFTVTPQALSALPYKILPKSTYQLRDVCYQRMDEGTDSITVTFQSNATGPKLTSNWKAHTKITSVEEEASILLSISTVGGAITASWQGAGVSNMIVSDLQGRKLGDVAIPTGATSASVALSSYSTQIVIVALVNNEGSTIHSAKLQLP